MAGKSNKRPDPRVVTIWFVQRRQKGLKGKRSWTYIGRYGPTLDRLHATHYRSEDEADEALMSLSANSRKDHEWRVTWWQPEH